MLFRFAQRRPSDRCRWSSNDLCFSLWKNSDTRSPPLRREERLHGLFFFGLGGFKILFFYRFTIDPYQFPHHQVRQTGVSVFCRIVIRLLVLFGDKRLESGRELKTAVEKLLASRLWKKFEKDRSQQSNERFSSCFLRALSESKVLVLQKIDYIILQSQISL